MIFATVGTQLPFERLIRALDRMAPAIGAPVIAQTGALSFAPAHIETHSVMAPTEFDERFRSAELIVAHAGIGTILMAKRHGKPLIIFPRRAALGEHRNDHQIATARSFAEEIGVHVAYEEEDLERLISERPLAPASDAPPAERAPLLQALNAFAHGLDP
ncbi:MAG: glycosyltransferase [Pseudomonadota bacterium]